MLFYLGYAFPFWVLFNMFYIRYIFYAEML